jgi:large subunit ribosomal protein L25
MTAQSTTPTLHADIRTLIGKQSRQLRTIGKLPAVVYGNKQESVSITLDYRIFSKLFREVGTTTLIDLALDEKKTQKVLVHDIQTDPTTRKLIHVDLLLVNMKEKLQTQIPLNFIGSSDAVDVLGGILVHVKTEVEIECLPQDLIQELNVDISSLKTFDDAIRISDITLPAGMIILDEQDEVIVSITEPRSEEEMAALDEVSTVDAAAVPSETASGTDQVAEEAKDDKK